MAPYKIQQNYNLFFEITIVFFRYHKSMVSDRLENVTQTISRILEGYDIRLRPNFGGNFVVKFYAM